MANDDPSAQIIQAIIADALSELDDKTILERAFQRVLDTGVPLMRCNVSQPVLHPTVGGNLHIWSEKSGKVETENWTRSAEQGGNYTQTPFHQLISQPEDTMRYTLCEPGSFPPLPILQDLHDSGATDYFAMRIDLGSGMNLGAARVILTSTASCAAVILSNWLCLTWSRMIVCENACQSSRARPSGQSSLN